MTLFVDTLYLPGTFHLYIQSKSHRLFYLSISWHDCGNQWEWHAFRGSLAAWWHCQAIEVCFLEVYLNQPTIQRWHRWWKGASGGTIWHLTCEQVCGVEKGSHMFLSHGEPTSQGTNSKFPPHDINCLRPSICYCCPKRRHTTRGTRHPPAIKHGGQHDRWLNLHIAISLMLLKAPYTFFWWTCKVSND